MHDAHHVNQCVGRAQLMQVDLVGIVPVYPGLGGKEGVERGGGAFAGVGGQCGCPCHGVQHLPRAVARRRRHVHQGARAPYLAAHLGGHRDFDARDAEGINGLFHGVQGQASVQQRAEEHIAAGAADGLDVGGFHGRRAVSTIRSTSLRLPERRPFRSRDTQRYPSSFSRRVISSRWANASSISSAPTSMRHSLS